MNLGFYSTLFRTYDPAIGKFMQIDPLADFFSGITPYSFAFDNPISYNDPDGLAPMWWLKLRANVKQIGYNLTGRRQYHASIVGRHKGNSIVVQAGLSTWKTHKPTPNPRTEQIARTYAKEEPDPVTPTPEPDPKPDPISEPTPDPTPEIPTFRDKSIPPGDRINYSEGIQFEKKTDHFANPESLKSQLDDLIKLLVHNTVITVYIAGNVGLEGFIQGNSPAALNQGVTMNGVATTARTLMNARAKAVYDFLVGQGVNPKQLIYGTGNVMSGERAMVVSFEIRNK